MKEEADAEEQTMEALEEQLTGSDNLDSVEIEVYGK